MGYRFSAVQLLQSEPAVGAGGGSAPPSDSPTLPDIGPRSVLYVCRYTKNPDTKNPVNPNDCVKVALVEHGAVKSLQPEGLELGLAALIVLLTAFISYRWGRSAALTQQPAVARRP